MFEKLWAKKKGSYHRAVGSSPGVGQLIDQNGDAAFGSEVEVRSADHETLATPDVLN